MIQTNNLNAIREFTVQQPIRKWVYPATADRRFDKWPPFRIPANSLAGFLYGIQKQSPDTGLFIVIKTCCFGQFHLGNAEIDQPLHFTFR